MLLDAHSHIVMINDVYGGTRRYFENIATRTQGLQLTDVDLSDLTRLEKSLRSDTKVAIVIINDLLFTCFIRWFG